MEKVIVLRDGAYRGSEGGGRRCSYFPLRAPFGGCIIVKAEDVNGAKELAESEGKFYTSQKAHDMI